MPAAISIVPIFIYSLCLLSFEFDVVHGNFLGGTVSWKCFGSKLRVTYRLAWEKGTGPCGPGCNISDVGTEVSHFSPEIASLKWEWVDGNDTTLHDLSYVLTSISLSDVKGWEQGEAMFEVNVTLSPIFVRNVIWLLLWLTDIPWIRSSNAIATELGSLETSISMANGSDIGRSNQSPYSSLPSFLGIPHNCTRVVEIPAEDPDGDRVRCRWAEPSECGGGCTNLPIKSVWLDPDSCKISINAEDNNVHDVFRVAVVIEDYVLYNVMVGSSQHIAGEAFSRIPFQITIRIESVPCDVNWGPKSTSPLLRHNLHVVYTPDMFRTKTIINVGYFLKQGKASGLDFIISGPRFLKYEYNIDDLDRTDVTKLSINWTPKPPYQVGDVQLCIWGVDSTRITSDPTCIVDIIFDLDHCHTVTCENNGTCRNIFGDPLERCECDVGYTGHNCSRVLQCEDGPCINNGTCTPYEGSFTCICDTGYTGVHCETRITACTSSPCQNRGACLDQPGSFQCISPGNYTGHCCRPENIGLPSSTTTLSYTSTIPIAKSSTTAGSSDSDNKHLPLLWGMMATGCFLITAVLVTLVILKRAALLNFIANLMRNRRVQP